MTKITTRILTLGLLLMPLVTASSPGTYKQVSMLEKTMLEKICQPITFTKSGVRSFLSNSFNASEYCQDFLPHNFLHFIQFLEYGQKTKQEAHYIQSSIRLFSNKLKEAHYVTSYAFGDLLNQLPPLLERYFQRRPQKSLLENIQTRIKDILYANFLNRFSVFKNEPDNFFEDLTQEIAKEIGQNTFKEELTQEQLRNTLIRFLEVALSKVIWCPCDNEDIWDSVKDMAAALEQLEQRSIITQLDLNDLYKSLIERFCHFLELAGSQLPAELINKIKQEIAAGNLLLTELDEQEELIETKKSRAMRALDSTHGAILAKDYGIITEVIPNLK